MAIETIAFNDRKSGPYTATEAQTAFTYDFPIYAENELTVLRDRAGTVTQLTLNVDYTVSGVGNPGGGTVTLAVGAEEDDVIAIDGDLVEERTSAYAGSLPYTSKNLDADANRLTIMAQERQRDANRSIRRHPTDKLTGALWLPANVTENTLVALDETGKVVGLLAKDFFQGASGGAVAGPDGGVTDGHAVLFDGASGLLLKSAGFAPRSASAPVPIADLESIATASILGRVTAATGAVEVLTAAQVLALLATQDAFLGTSGSLIRAALPAFDGLVITNNAGVPTTAIDIDANGAILVNSSGVGIRIGPVDVTINATTNGANGLDTGSLAANTWYHEFVIYNPTTATIAGLLSLSETAPTMPSGYTFSARAGSRRTRGAATFDRVRQVGNRAQYQVVTSSVTPGLPSMASGSAGNPVTPTWVAVAVGNYVAPSARRIIAMLYAETGSHVMAAPNNSYGHFDDHSNPPFIHHNTEAAVPFDMVLESTNIYWASSGATGELYCAGWVDAVNAN